MQTQGARRLELALLAVLIPSGCLRTLNISPVSGGIYLVRGDAELVEMRETPYEAQMSCRL